jgi:hypothetical protein
MRQTRWSHASWAVLGLPLAAGAVFSLLVIPALGATSPASGPWEVTDHRRTTIGTSTERSSPTARRVAAPSTRREANPPAAPAATARRKNAAPTTRAPVRRVATRPPATARPASQSARPTTQRTRRPYVTTRPATATSPAVRSTATRSPSRPATTSRPPTVATWRSGVTGPGSTDSSLTAVRGGSPQIVGIFADTTATVQSTLPALATVKDFRGDVDIALGGLTDDSPETWAEAADGAYLSRWTQAARTLRAARAGKPGTVYVRFAHELNGDWFPWAVNSRTVNDFHRAWILFHDVLATEFPQAKLVFCVNTGSRSDIGVEAMWPGDRTVDVVGIDIHAGWEPTDAAGWHQRLNDVTDDGGPRGLGAWLAFAQRHGKPLAVSRWGLDAGSATTDDGTRVRLMHEFLSTHAATAGRSPAGRVIYDIFFNYPNGDDTRSQITDPRNATSATVFKSLRWGT